MVNGLMASPGISVLPSVQRPQAAQNRLMQVLTGQAPILAQRGPRSASGAQALADALRQRASRSTPVYHAGDAIAAFGNPIVAALAQRRADTAAEAERRRKEEAEKTKRSEYMGALSSAIERAKDRQETVTEPGSGQSATQTVPGMSLADALLASGNPEAAELGMKLKIQEVKQAQSQSPETFGAPVEAVDSEGNPVFIRAGSQGGVRELEAYAPPPPKPGDPPSAVQEYEYYRNLPPEQQEAYLRVQRANRPVDIGGSLVVPSQAQPGQVAGEFQKTIPPEKTPEARGAVKEAELSAADRAERRAALPAMQRAMSELELQQNVVQEDIGRALDLIDWNTVGATGAALSGIPGTQAYNLARALDTIRANVGFDKLQAMREASPTGGALGQVSERENTLLQSVLGSLDQGQDDATFRKNLERLRDTLQKRAEMRRDAFQQDFGGIEEDAGGGWSIRKVD